MSTYGLTDKSYLSPLFFIEARIFLKTKWRSPFCSGPTNLKARSTKIKAMTAKSDCRSIELAHLQAAFEESMMNITLNRLAHFGSSLRIKTAVDEIPLP
jgi:hypothetical protein